MNTLNYYIIKQIVIGLCLVLAVMLGIVWLTQSLRLIDMIVSKGLSVWLFIKLTGLLLPTFLVILMPIALFAVTLFTYNRMNGDKELAVIKSAGVHPLRIAGPALLVGLVLTAIAYVMTFKLVPESVVDFKEMQWSIKNDLSRVLLQEGEFNQLGQGLTIYIKKKDGDDIMYGILINDQRDGHKETVIAERGMIIGEKSDMKAIIENGSRQELDDTTGKFSILSFDKYVLDFGIKPGAHGRSKDTRELSLDNLLKGYNENPIFLIEINKRFAIPLYNICFAFLAVTLIIKGRYNRKGQTPKVILSALIMLAIEAFQLGIENLASKHTGLIFLIYGNALLPCFICFYILYAKHPFAFMYKDKYSNLSIPPSKEA